MHLPLNTNPISQLLNVHLQNQRNLQPKPWLILVADQGGRESSPPVDTTITLSLTHQTMTARAQTDKPGKAHGSSMFIAVSDVAKSKTGLSEPPETHTDLINRLKTHSVWLWVWFGNHCTCHQQVEQLCRMLAHQNEQLRTTTANMVIATFLAPAKMQGNTLEKHVSQKKRTCVSS